MNPDEPAFPCDVLDFQPGTGNQVARIQFQGMTLRDYFAAKFLQGLIASNPDTNMASKDAIQITVKACYMMADAMLKERLK